MMMPILTLVASFSSIENEKHVALEKGVLPALFKLLDSSAEVPTYTIHG